ncbi:MAG: CHASE2 domain-containing protein [Pseudomonadota bacterium]
MSKRAAFSHVLQSFFAKVQRDYFWAIPFLVAIFAAPFDPFGMTSLTQERSREVYNRVLSPFYQSQGFDETVIVLIDDRYLEFSGDTYPIARSNYIPILDSVLSAQPAALFIDVHFSSDRGAVEETEILSEYISLFQPEGSPDALGLPVILGSDLGGDLQNIDKFSLGGSIRTAPVLLRGVIPPMYPLCVTAEGYPARCAEEDSRQAPALALYDRLCRSDVSRNCDAIDPREALFTRWSRQPEPGREVEPGCHAFPRETVGKTLLSARLLWEGIFARELAQSDLVQRCFPFQTIDAVDLFSMDIDAQRNAFEGRTVFLGAYFSLAPDLTQSPVHGEVPGVFYHAMAYDNLVTFEDGYWRVDVERDTNAVLGFNSLSTLLDIATVMALLAAYLSASFQQSRFSAEAAYVEGADWETRVALSNARKGFFSAVQHVVLFASIILVFGVVLPSLVRIVPTNFYGAILLILPAAAGLLTTSLSRFALASLEHGTIGNVFDRIDNIFR